MLVRIIPRSRRGLAGLAATALVLALSAAAPGPYLGASSAVAAPVTCSAGTCSATFTPAGASLQEWDVPNGVGEATFTVNGAGGGSDTYGGNGGAGGSGARVTATLPVTGGESLTLLVGTGGQRVETAQGGPGGYGGGGSGGTGTELGAAGGGGGSFVFRAQTPLIVAGGGGGAAVEGLEGGDAGMTGSSGGNYESYSGGEGATQSSPGAGGRGFATGASGTGPTAGPGALAQGGAGEGVPAKFAGGGGGGGYYGGGGGGGGGTGSLSNEYSKTGGGGGSSYVDSGTNVGYSSSGGAGGYGYENFNEESVEVPPEPGSIVIGFAQPTTSVSLTASSLSPAVSSVETLTATVSPVPSSGTIAFVEGASAVAGCGSVTVDQSGEASCTTEYSSAGAHELLAEYSGSADTVYPSASSAPLDVVARTAVTPTSTSLESSSTSPAMGAVVTLAATVSPVPDGGSVAFVDGSAAISGCAAVPIDVSTGRAACATSFSVAGAHAIRADFSGSLDGVFAASSAETLAVSVTAPPRAGGHSGSITTASTSPTASTSSAAATSTTTPTAPPLSPVFALSILTHAAKPLINRRALAIRSRCGSVSCTVSATATVVLPGRGRLSVGEASAALAAGEPGNVLIAVPAKLRTAVRDYLRHHRHAAITLRVVLNAAAPGHATQTSVVTLGVWTYGGYR
jgi:hypothetical protein